MAGGLEATIELPFDRRYVDDVLVARGRAEHQRLQSCVEDERRHRVDELRLEEFDGRHLGEQEPPRVAVAQVDLLQILVEVPLGEQMSLAGDLLRQEPHLGEFGGRGRLEDGACGSVQADRTQAGVAAFEHVVAAHALVAAE